MPRMLDCLVSYFGLDEGGRPGHRRYFCYHVVAGPGATADGGLALATTLAVHNAGERCASCEAIHAVESGGPAAALAEVVRYLDSYHREDHVWKVQSEVRGLDGSSPRLKAGAA
jgi:hypothetical protein